MIWPSAKRRFKLRERSTFNVEFVTDLDGRDGVTRSQLRQQRILARGDAEWAQGIVVNPRDDPRKLTHTGR